MFIFTARAAIFAALTIAGATAFAASATPRDTVSALHRQDAGSRDRIARLELDRLVERVAIEMPALRRVEKPQIDREVVLYAF